MRNPESIRAFPPRATSPSLRGAPRPEFQACAAPVLMVADAPCAMGDH